MADEHDFETVALAHLDAVYRAAVALSHREQDAQDLVQTTYLKAMEKFHSFQRGTNCKAWLLRILRNTWIDGLRHRKVVGPELPIEENMLAAPPAPEEFTWSNPEEVVESFSDEQVIDALRELPEEQRLAVLLVDVERLTHAEVAEVTGVAVGTVKSRTHRGRARLKARLSALAEDLGLVGGER